MNSLISERCNNLLPSDILVPGAFSRPQNAIWSPEQIVQEILHFQEGVLSGQLLDHHKFQNKDFLKPVPADSSPNAPAPVTLHLPDSALSEIERETKRLLTVSPGYPPKIFAGLNRLKCKRRPTVSGFCQARMKLSAKVCEDISNAFTEQIFNEESVADLDKLVFAIDGSTVPILVNFDEAGNIVCTAGKPRAGLHLNAACALNAGNILAAVIIQSEGKKNEHSAALDMIKKLHSQFPDKRLVFIMDRLYFSYKLAEYCQENNIELIIRLQSKVFSKLSGGAPLDQFIDRNYSVICSSRMDRETKGNPSYRYVAKDTIQSIRDELQIPEEVDLTLNYRLAAVEIPEEVKTAMSGSVRKNTDDSNGFTYIYTTLSQEELPVNDLTDWYFWRWQIEVSYGNLKFKTGMNALHSRKENNILQEIWISILKYNAACAIINDQTAKLCKKKRRSKRKGKPKQKNDPRAESQKTQTVFLEGVEPEYEAKISFGETAKNLHKFLLGQINEKEFLDELDLGLVYTLPGRHTPRGTTKTRVHGTHWSFH